MANRERGAVSLEINGSAYTFRLTTAAMVELEEACSTPARQISRPDGSVEAIPAVEMTFPQILKKVLNGSTKHTVLFVWASLLDAHPRLTVAEVQKLIDDAGGLLAFGQQVQDIVKASSPEEDDARPQKAQGGGTGGGSTSRRAKSA